MLYHKSHVSMECMFDPVDPGIDADSGCTQCIANKFWTGSYKAANNPNWRWFGVDFQLTFTGDRCTEIQGLYTIVSFWPLLKHCIFTLYANINSNYNRVVSITYLWNITSCNSNCVLSWTLRFLHNSDLCFSLIRLFSLISPTVESLNTQGIHKNDNIQWNQICVLYNDHLMFTSLCILWCHKSGSIEQFHLCEQFGHKNMDIIPLD